MPTLKTCIDCSIDKPLSAFYVRSDTGRPRGSCKTCWGIRTKAFQVANRKVSAEYTRKWRNANREACRDYDREYAQAYPHLHAAKEAKRRAAKLKRTPSWLDSDDFFLIKEFYETASSRSLSTNTPWEVDHIIPLRGRLVSGLHVPSNLQLLPALANSRKSNTFNTETYHE